MNNNATLSTNTYTTIEKKGISGSTLKLIAIFTMLIDHTAAAILENILNKRGMADLDWNNNQAVVKFVQENVLLCNIDATMRTIGRLAFPIFCFLLVEGFLHTHNKWKYAVRLALFSLVSEIPFDLAFNGRVLEFSHQNVFFTLLIGLSVMIGFEFITDRLKDKKWLPVLAIVGAILTGCIEMPFSFNFIQKFDYIISRNGLSMIEFSRTDSIILGGIISLLSLLIYGIMIKKTSLKTASVKFAYLAVMFAGMILAEILKTDYSGFGVLTIALMYGLRKDRFKAMASGCVTLTVLSLGEISAFFNLIFIHFYNGKRGFNLKYIFYLFYPVHLLVLYLICYLMKLV
jgi:TraX protein.